MQSSQLLSLLLFVFGAIIFVNCLLSLALWRYQRDEYHWLTLKLWLGTLVCNVSQGIFPNKDIFTVLGFSTAFICTVQLTRILALASEVHTPQRSYQSLMGAMVGCALVASRLHTSLFWMAIGPAIGISFPMFHSVYLTIRQRGFFGTGMIQVFLVLLVLYGIHFMDYPFLRHDDANAFVAFSLTLVLVFCFSIFLPTYSIANIDARYAVQLEREVVRRTESLYAANQEVKQLSEEHDHLLRLVVHDIANPLALLRFHVDKLENIAGKESGSSTVLGKMHLAVDTMVEVLKNVKNLHSLRTGKTSLNLGPVPIVEALQEQVTMFEPRLQEKNLRIRLEKDPGSPETVLAEPTSLKNHVLANLISNAIKFSDPGTEITLKVEGNAEDGVRLIIADRGVGIPADLIPRLFDLKKPTSRAGTRGEKGVGFGMPIVKTYLDRYGAKIVVKSTVKSESPSDHGTQFEIQFKKIA